MIAERPQPPSHGELHKQISRTAGLGERVIGLRALACGRQDFVDAVQLEVRGAGCERQELTVMGDLCSAAWRQALSALPAVLPLALSRPPKTSPSAIQTLLASL